jgi:hypothetical protein
MGRSTLIAPRSAPDATASRVAALPLPTWLLGVVLAVTGPLLLFHYGSYHWFRLDDWAYLQEQGVSGFPPLFEPHGGPHWMAVPRVIYWALFRVFGVKTYLPYQATVVITHLVIAALLYRVMRRAGVRPWLCLAPVASYALVGPGAVNSVWGFQVGFNGSVAWGLGHLLLADHDGPANRRDVFALGCGLLATTSSAAGPTMVVGVAVAVLLRRGWKLALLHSAPLLALYASWVVLADASTTGEFGSPPLSRLWGWFWSSMAGTFIGFARFEVLAWFFAGVLIVGMTLTLVATGRRALPELASRLAMPIGLVTAAVFFSTTTYFGRWWTAAGARSDRYVYVVAALVLPIVAVAAEAIARRWRHATPALVALFLLPVPFNMANFDTGVYDELWMEQREYTLTTAVRMPFARDVPPDVRPMSSAIVEDPASIGFLLELADNGYLDPSTGPISAATISELTVRLGVARSVHDGPPAACPTYTEPVMLRTRLGDVVHLGTGVTIATFDGERPSDRKVPFPASFSDDVQLTVELPDLWLWIGPPRGAKAFRACLPQA